MKNQYIGALFHNFNTELVFTGCSQTGFECDSVEKLEKDTNFFKCIKGSSFQIERIYVSIQNTKSINNGIFTLRISDQVFFTGLCKKYDDLYIIDQQIIKLNINSGQHFDFFFKNIYCLDMISVSLIGKMIRPIC
jgi:hypothetical protein